MHAHDSWHRSLWSFISFCLPDQFRCLARMSSTYLILESVSEWILIASSLNESFCKTFKNMTSDTFGPTWSIGKHLCKHVCARSLRGVRVKLLSKDEVMKSKHPGVQVRVCPEIRRCRSVNVYSLRPPACSFIDDRVKSVRQSFMCGWL